MLLFSMMSPSDAMFETFFCVFPVNVNERGDCVKIDRDFCWCRPGL